MEQCVMHIMRNIQLRWPTCPYDNFLLASIHFPSKFSYAIVKFWFYIESFCEVWMACVKNWIVGFPLEYVMALGKQISSLHDSNQSLHNSLLLWQHTCPSPTQFHTILIDYEEQLSGKQVPWLVSSEQPFIYISLLFPSEFQDWFSPWDFGLHPRSSWRGALASSHNFLSLLSVFHLSICPFLSTSPWCLAMLSKEAVETFFIVANGVFCAML